MIGSAIVHQGGGQLAPSLPLAEIRQWAAVFVESGMFKDVRDVSKAVVKIQAGQELGLPPFAAMRGFDIIEGKPAPNAGLTAALVRRSGRYDYRVTRSDAVACEIEWLDGGRVVGVSSFTLDEAKAAGIAGKQVWRAYAADMLFARALTRGARRYCADVFLGSVYTPEELGDDSGPIIEVERAERATIAPPPEFDAPPLLDDAAPADAPASVDSWGDLVAAATTGREAVALFNRIGREEQNPYRQAGAQRLAALRFCELLPESMPVEAIQPTLDKLGAMLAALTDAAVPSAQHEAHDAALATLDANLIRLMGMQGADDEVTVS